MTLSSLDPELVAQRYLERDGSQLVSYREVGLPFFRISVQALVMEHKPLDAFSEFLLRSIEIGIEESDGASRLLGLERSLTDPVVAALVSSNDVAPSRDPSGRATAMSLTAKGAVTLKQLGEIKPTEAWIDIDFDALLQSPVEPNRNLVQPDQLRGAGATAIRPMSSRPPEVEDLNHNAVERMIQELAGVAAARAKRTLLGFKPIERRKRRMMFAPALMLIYRTPDQSAVRIEFAVDGRLSDAHARAFARTKQRERIEREVLGGPSAEDAARTILAESVVERVRSSPAPDLQQKIALASLLESEGATDDAVQVAAKQAEDKLATEKFRFLETFEHREVLADVLVTARERLLIISPWIRRGVVDGAFLSKLEQRLRAGVRVFIGWGISSQQPDPDADPAALQGLEELAARHANFTLARLGDTHAKILVCDDRFAVVGSFNWLSFRGDPDRTYRDERSVLIRTKVAANTVFDREVRRFPKTGVHPTPPSRAH